MSTVADKTTRIRVLNDAFLATFLGGRVVMTPGVAALPEHDRAQVLERVRSFDAFSPDNDPHGEHDFGSFDHGGRTIFWKIDLYDRDYKFYSPDPTDPAKTNRVLTILLAEEY